VHCYLLEGGEVLPANVAFPLALTLASSWTLGTDRRYGRLVMKLPVLLELPQRTLSSSGSITAIEFQ
jgi:hypothetical protein